MTANENQRAEIIKRFIQIAKYLIKYNNFCVADSIYKGLKHPCIQRLLRTWKV